MSIEAMRYVWKHSRQRGSALVAMLAIADMADDDGDCWPGVAHLTEKCRLKSERALQKITEKLEKAGELQVFPGEGARTSSGWTNRYHVVGVGSEAAQEVNADSPLQQRGVNPDSPHGVNADSPPAIEGVNADSPHGVNPDSPDPSTDPSITTDPPVDPPTTTDPELRDSAHAHESDPVPGDVVDDDVTLIDPEVRKLHLSDKAKTDLLARGAKYALAVAWDAQGPGAHSPGGLAVHLMGNGGPSEAAMDRAALALELRTIDRDELDHVLRQREAAAVIETARESAEGPVAAGASPAPPTPSDGLDEHPAGSPLSYRDIWIAARGELSIQIDKPSFEAFFKSAKAVCYRDGVLTLQVRSILARDMAEKHYKHDVEAALAKRVGGPVTVVFVSEQQPLHQVDLGVAAAAETQPLATINP